MQVVNKPCLSDELGVSFGKMTLALDVVLGLMSCIETELRLSSSLTSELEDVGSRVKMFLST